MARRLALAILLALAGLAVIALAELPAWAMGRPFHRVAVPATITDNTVEVLGHGDNATRMCRPRWHYVFEGRGYDGGGVAQDSIRLRPDPRRVGDLRPGDTLVVWIDPNRPGTSSWHEDRPLGNEPGQWVFGGMLVAAGLAVAVAAFVRPRRRLSA
jgi:hypothetical protein